VQLDPVRCRWPRRGRDGTTRSRLRQEEGPGESLTPEREHRDARSGGCGFELAIPSKVKNQPTRRLHPRTSHRYVKRRLIRTNLWATWELSGVRATEARGTRPAYAGSPSESACQVIHNAVCSGSPLMISVAHPAMNSSLPARRGRRRWPWVAALLFTPVLLLAIAAAQLLRSSAKLSRGVSRGSHLLRIASATRLVQPARTCSSRSTSVRIAETPEQQASRPSVPVSHRLDRLAAQSDPDWPVKHNVTKNWPK